MNLSLPCPLRGQQLPTVSSGLLVLFLFSFSACQLFEDKAVDDRSSTACQISMLYDAETTTLIQPANASEASQLSDLDKAVMLPKREREIVELCLDDQNNYTVSTEYGTPEHPIEYPPHTAGVWLNPDYKRVVNHNGQLTYYNSLNEVLRTDFTPGDQLGEVSEILSLFQEIKTLPPLTNQNFSAALDSLAAHGLTMTAHSGNIVSHRTDHADGSYSIVAIDKNARMQVGQLDYDANGALSTLYMLQVEGVAPDVVFKRLKRVFFFDAVESGVRMRHQTTTDFKTFSLTIN
ncbi:MAG: hypothetical protein IPM98_08920 [Lewinellaceae bacterium]|nr:hypothetical protein [Lewinellaceae bacterium]